MSSWMDYFRRRRGGSSYAPLPANDSTDEIAPGPGPNQAVAASQSRVGSPLERARRARRLAGFTAVTLMAAMVGYLAVMFLQPSSRPCDTPGHGFQCSNPITHYWGQYSPYFSVPSDVDPAVPKHCELTFAQVLSRHGARAPTTSRAAYYANLVDRIHAGAIYYSPGFHFLSTYNYTLGVDDLTPLGEQQMVNSGLKFYRRYRALARKGTPFVRTAGQERVVRSAVNFTQGFHAALLADRKSTATPPTLPYPMLVIPETPASQQNNTLHHGLCTAFESGSYSSGAAAQAAYLSTFAPALTARLNTALPGTNLSDADTIALLDLCPFETVAGPGDGSLAPFCNLFSPAEWRKYDYFQSLGKWYDFGPGCALGPTQGVGWVNELLARLTGRPVEDRTSSNSTLDGDSETFPLGRALYADFSHDNDMVGVLGALGVYEGVAGLDNTTRQEPGEVGGFSVSWAVPFAARVYVEKMRCKGEEGEKVRVLVNDRVVRLKGCRSDERGMCELGRFVESMGFARGGGRWDMCFA